MLASIKEIEYNPAVLNRFRTKSVALLCCALVLFNASLRVAHCESSDGTSDLTLQILGVCICCMVEGDSGCTPQPSLTDSFNDETTTTHFLVCDNGCEDEIIDSLDSLTPNNLKLASPVTVVASTAFSFAISDVTAVTSIPRYQLLIDPWRKTHLLTVLRI